MYYLKTIFQHFNMEFPSFTNTTTKTRKRVFAYKLLLILITATNLVLLSGPVRP